jgi:ribosomal protein S1
VGDWIQVKVLKVDPEMKRIALSRKALVPVATEKTGDRSRGGRNREKSLDLKLRALEAKYRKGH